MFDLTQQAAQDMCCDLSRRVVGVTGAAGTGKTTIIKKVYEEIVSKGKTVALAAPTGKAAKRITESTGIAAQTLHRLLKYPRPGERDDKGKALKPGFPRHDAEFPLPFDYVITDEFSMVNTEVHRNLMNALPNGRGIRMFGDLNQLRPIEQSDYLMSLPSPFAQMLDKFPHTVLTNVYRQGEGSGILGNAQKILAKRMPQRLDDFALKFTESPVTALQDMIFEQLDAGISFADIDNQIIVPGRKTWVGTVKLNAMLQNMFRSESDGWVELPRHKWDRESRVRVRPGDKVICTENNYDLEVFNGEVGIVQSTDDATVVIDFGDRIVSFPPEVCRTHADGRTSFYDPRPSLDLAYALTTHKMQGSECKRVVYILNKSNTYMQSRSNFYTAITRAREHVTVITDQRSLTYSINYNGK
jgi:exodeoxyribonuclease V alpha subunit